MKLTPVVGFFILIVCVVSAEQGQQEVKPGQNVSLQCLDPEGAAVIMVSWRRTGLQPVRYLLFYRENRFYEHYQHESFRGRVEVIRSSSMKDGDFSVILQNVSIKDSGTYECLITTRNPGGGDSELRRSINLTVSDKEQPEDGGDEQENLGVRGQEETGDGGKEENPTVVKLILGVSIATLILLYCIFCLNIYVMNRGRT
ncbi:uncharacterized protein V3H82_014676 [Fundulus diaphanus]